MAAAFHTRGAGALAILVIDDEDYVADMIATALDLEGYTVHVAYNGRDGLEQARALHIDLMIVDIMMPYLSGIALIEQLREQGLPAAVPIVLISAGARPPRQLPNVTFVPKPFSVDQLLDLISQRIGRPEGKSDGV